MNGPLAHAALAAAGISAGFINTVAGGGSLLTLPVLMLLGLPPDVANGTNRLSIVTQSLTGAAVLERLGQLDRRGLVPVIVASALGSLGGALLATRVPNEILRIVLLVALVLMATLILIEPRAIGAPAGTGEPLWATRRAAGFIGLFAAGLYGGFIQAGVGFLILAVLGGILHYDVLGAAALKAICTLVYGLVAVAVFAAVDDVVWSIAAPLAVYTAIGSLLGIKLARRAPHLVLRIIAFVMVVATSVGALIRG
ncbi:MAG TPA: sulfite exporter TauE/SafE family protein [Kofleriaceae bacterium]|nr:sulfite exporter TauE/SafE family protein [Kofleriaceae bacterium]